LPRKRSTRWHARRTGQTFCVGAVRMQGLRLSQPCKYLARITGEPGLLPGLVDRGGLRARLLDEGILRVGDAVQPVNEEPESR